MLTKAALAAAARRAERVFPQLTHCGRCHKFLSAEFIYPRMYNLPGFRAVFVLCARCNTEVPVDSAADLEFQADIRRLALASAPPGGRA